MSTIESHSRAAPWLMLVSRTALFAGFQCILALLLSLAGNANPWEASQAWWLISVLLTNLIVIFLLIRLMRAEGRAFFEIFSFRRSTAWKDLGITILVYAVAMPLATFPGQWMAQLLFGSSDATFTMMFRALPIWAAVVAFLMPVTHIFAELSTYFGYSMPRLATSLGRPWLALAISSFALALQHITIPLIADPRFIAWRFGMFLPLAFYIGLCIKLRPSLLPFIAVGHGLLDLPLAIIVLTLSL